MAKTNRRPTKGKDKDEELRTDDRKRGSAKKTRRGKADAMDSVGRNTPSDKDNDPSWYANNEYLLRDAASLAYSNPAGVPVRFQSSILHGSNSTGSGFSIPGIWTLSIAPSVGQAANADDPVNIAARNIYSYVRHANSGHANYDAPNLMMYLLAMDSLYSAYSWCARAYGLIRTYSQKNRYIPEALFKAMGLDYNNFLMNQVNFRYWLNTVAEKIGSLCVPASMTYMMRHMWMFQNVFVDNMGLKAQMYVYNPDYFLKYDPVHTIGDGKAPALINHLNINPGATATSQAIMTAVNEMIEAVMQDEDMNIMSGDILKAFGEGSVWKLVPIHEDYDIAVVYSDEVLHQIHNAISLDVSPWWATPTHQNAAKIYEHVDATTATSWLVERPMKFKQPIGPSGLILDVRTDEPTPALNMVATRLMVSARDLDAPSTTAAPELYVDTCGSEVVTSMHVTRASVTTSTTYDYVTSQVYSGYDIENWNAVLDTMLQLAVFDMHPIVYPWKAVSSGKPATYTYSLRQPASDIDNFTIVTPDILRKMHETALLSEFNVPLMGSWAHKLF